MPKPKLRYNKLPPVLPVGQVNHGVRLANGTYMHFVLLLGYLYSLWLSLPAPASTLAVNMESKVERVEESANFNLEDYRLHALADRAYYVPEWVTEEQEAALVRAVYSAPRPKWTQLSGRRAQAWGGTPSARGMLREPLPAWLAALARRVRSLTGLPAPNHVLINEYLPGQGILPHRDGALFLPCVTTLSLGGPAALRYWREGEAAGGVLLRGRSVLVVAGELYTGHEHGIAEVEADELTGLANEPRAQPGEVLARGTRVSLTFRHVPNASACLLRLANT